MKREKRRGEEEKKRRGEEERSERRGEEEREEKEIAGPADKNKRGRRER